MIKNERSFNSGQKKKRWIKRIKILAIILVILGVGIVGTDAYMSAPMYPKGNILMKKIEASAQYQEGKFKNTVGWEQPSFGEYASTTWDFLFKRGNRKPKGKIPVQSVDVKHFLHPGDKQLRVTWLGHSSLMVNIDGFKLLADPVLETKISILGPSRFNGDVPLDINKMPHVDAILISHNHYDHLNKFTIQFMKDKTDLFVVSLGVGAQLEKWGVDRKKIKELNWWEEYQVNEKVMIAATPAQHFSGRGLSDRDKTLWVSYVVQAPYHRIFFGGDSGYFADFKTIGTTYGPFDMTFLECGAYNEKWHHIHMYPEETVQAHLDLKGKVLHPIHWGTFNLSLHSWDEPMKRFTAAARAAQVQVAIPVVGETTVYGEYLPEKQWWMHPKVVEQTVKHPVVGQLKED